MTRVGFSQIASSMRHRKSTYASLVLEVALGCTVVAYVLALGAGLRDVSNDSLGFEPERTFVVRFEQPVRGSHEQRYARELAELAALPGVEVAAWVELPPLSRSELPEALMTPGGPRLVSSLRGDEHVARALGAEVRDGRMLTAADSRASGPLPVLVTRKLADKLGPQPLGASLSSPGFGSLLVVGIVDEPLRLDPFYAGATDIVIMPVRPSQGRRTSYLVRARRLTASSFAARAAAELRASQPARWLAVERLSETRELTVRNVRGADTIILITVFGMVLVVLVGSLGMASSLIVERARQIGIRRALGARKSDIIGYFMLESLFATVIGVLVSTGICALLDELLVEIKGPLNVPWQEFLPIAAALFLLTGQLAVLVPARRAARIEPSVASRAT